MNSHMIRKLTAIEGYDGVAVKLWYPGIYVATTGGDKTECQNVDVDNGTLYALGDSKYVIYAVETSADVFKKHWAYVYSNPISTRVAYVVDMNESRPKLKGVIWGHGWKNNIRVVEDTTKEVPHYVWKMARQIVELEDLGCRNIEWAL